MLRSLLRNEMTFGKEYYVRLEMTLSFRKKLISLKRAILILKKRKANLLTFDNLLNPLLNSTKNFFRLQSQKKKNLTNFQEETIFQVWQL